MSMSNDLIYMVNEYSDLLIRALELPTQLGIDRDNCLAGIIGNINDLQSDIEKGLLK